MIEELLKSVHHPANRAIATIVGAGLLPVGTTTVFDELQHTLDRVFGAYSAQILVLGAEFTWVYAHAFGSRSNSVRPDAIPLPNRNQNQP